MTAEEVRKKFALHISQARGNGKQYISEVSKVIFDALEKQIPKFVKCPKGFQGVRDTRYYCPSCNSLTRQREDFCHKCGQAVKYPKEIYVKAENKIILDWSEKECE